MKTPLGRPYALIDPPSLFDTLETRESHRRELETWPKDAAFRDRLINRADQVIAEKKAETVS